MFYKTNDEQLNISIDEFVNEWHDKECWHRYSVAMGDCI